MNEFFKELVFTPKRVTLLARVRLAWYWLRSRYAAPNTFVSCSTCPNWIRHSRLVSRYARVNETDGTEEFGREMAHDAGVCALDVPAVFRDVQTGYALKIWTGRDFCFRHPLYDDAPVHGTDLHYRPGDPETARYAGFDRAPSFREALAMSIAPKDKESAGEIPPATDPEPVTRKPFGSLHGMYSLPIMGEQAGNESGNEPATKKE